MQALGVDSVETDMNTNTVRVRFDDENLSIDQIVGALTKAGYAVPGFSPSEAPSE
ncbi:MAG: heavy-metal-associated domain-containing protein [Myxococcota bacterium]